MQNFNRLYTTITLSLCITTLTGCRFFSPEPNNKKKTAARQGATNPNGTANTADPGTLDALITKSAFLKNSDFKAVTNLRKHTEEEIADNINNESKFFLNGPPLSGEDSACHNKLLGTARLSATKTLVWFDFTGQLASCTENGVTQTNNTTRMLFAKECINQDLSSYNGLHPDKTAEIKCKNGGRTYTAFSQQHSGSSSGDGMTLSGDYTMMWLEQSTDGKPCEVTQSGATFRNGPCTTQYAIKASNVKVNGVANNDNKGGYTKVDVSGLTFTTITDKYYTSGGATFVMDNISGTMTYSGATTAPKWEAKLSGSTKKIAGTFNPK